MRDRGAHAQLAAHQISGHADRDSSQKRNPPSPLMQRRRGHQRRHDSADRRTEQHAAERTRGAERSDSAAAIARRPLDHEHDRSCVLAADRQALHQAQDHHRHGRGDADLVVAREQSDEKSRDRHREHREGECVLAPLAVAHMTENQRSERAHQEARREHGERLHQRGGAAMRRKKVLPDRLGKKSVNRKVVPLEDVPGHSGDNRSALRVRFFDLLHQRSPPTRANQSAAQGYRLPPRPSRPPRSAAPKRARLSRQAAFLILPSARERRQCFVTRVLGRCHGVSLRGSGSGCHICNNIAG